MVPFCDLPVQVQVRVPVGALDSADAAPTTQQTATVTDLEKALNEQLSAWELVKSKDVPEVNKQLRKSGAPELDLQKPIASSADTAQTTSRDLD